MVRQRGGARSDGLRSMYGLNAYLAITDHQWYGESSYEITRKSVNVVVRSWSKGQIEWWHVFGRSMPFGD